MDCQKCFIKACSGGITQEYIFKTNAGENRAGKNKLKTVGIKIPECTPH